MEKETDSERAKIAFLFPGQGSQTVGMGVDVHEKSAAARHIFEAVDEALGISLSHLCFQGPEEALQETVNAQAAIVTVSLAILAALQESFTVRCAAGSSPLVPAYTAGHSVGEYTALVASGVIDLINAVRLVRERGRLMYREGRLCPGGMAAIIGMDVETLQEISAQAGIQAQTEVGGSLHPGQGEVTIANFNAPGQIVISGERYALAIAIEHAKERGAKKVIPLPVSGAFHSPVMKPAAAALAQAIDAVLLQNAAIPIISNITATPLTEAEAIREELARQIVAPVQWIRTIEYLVSVGVTTFVEIGPGQALSGMVKRIAKDVTTITISNMEEIQKGIDTICAL